MDCKLVTIERDEKGVWCSVQIIANALKFNGNRVDRPTICPSIGMGRSCNQDSKYKVSQEAKVILIFQK